MKKTLLLFAVLLASGLIGFSQTVTTFSDGTPDDAITMDATGNIYCSNYVGDTVFKFTPLGEMTSFITGLNTPNGLAFNSNQELYVCDGQGNTIYKYDIDGNLLNSYPIGGHPSGIVKSFNDDSMFFSLYLGNKIMHLATDGTITEISSAPELSGPVGIVFDELGALYVGNYNNREIYKVLANGDLEYLAQLPTEGGNLPNLGFITYGQGKLWGTVMGNDKIYTINPNAVDDYSLFAGSTQGSADGDIAEATFNTPNGIYYDSAEGKLLITDFGTKNLRIISDLVLGNDEPSILSQYKVVPNPIQEGFRILKSNLFSSILSIQIYNASGELIVANYDYHIGELINTAGWSKGVYVVQIKSEEGTLIQKIVK